MNLKLQDIWDFVDGSGNCHQWQEKLMKKDTPKRQIRIQEQLDPDI